MLRNINLGINTTTMVLLMVFLYSWHPKCHSDHHFVFRIICCECHQINRAYNDRTLKCVAVSVARYQVVK